MSSLGTNIDKSLELVQKTYNLQGTNNVHDNSSQHRVSIAKVSSHQPSRKTSVHDIHEANRDQLNKILEEIQGNLSRLKFLLETANSVASIRDEFFKLKDLIFVKLNEFISKLDNESGKRGSIVSKGFSSSLISHHPQHLVYCIEHFRSELVKSEYLFSSLTLSASIGTATLNSITVKPMFDSNYDQPPTNNDDMQAFKDLIQLKKDISILEEHAYSLNQRYYSQIPDWNETEGKLNVDGTLNNANETNINRFRFNPSKHKLSTTSSIASNDDLGFSARIYQKCQIVCCMCRPNYL